jgi:hypothetical protein
MPNKRLRTTGSVLLVEDAEWTGSVDTEAVDLKRCKGVAISLTWEDESGDADFAFKLQGSAEPADSELDDWIDVPDSDSASSADGSPIRWELENTVCRRLRVVATRTAGSLEGVNVRATTNDYPRTGTNDK